MNDGSVPDTAPAVVGISDMQANGNVNGIPKAPIITGLSFGGISALPPTEIHTVSADSPPTGVVPVEVNSIAQAPAEPQAAAPETSALPVSGEPVLSQAATPAQEFPADTSVNTGVAAVPSSLSQGLSEVVPSGAQIPGFPPASQAYPPLAEVSGTIPPIVNSETVLTKEEQDALWKEADQVLQEVTKEEYVALVMAELKTLQPDTIKYHGIEHTMNMARASTFLAFAEQRRGAALTSENIQDIARSGILHDKAYHKSPKGFGHEEKAIEEIVEPLKAMGLSNERIKFHQALISATQLKPVDSTVPLEDWILNPIPVKEIYDRFQIQIPFDVFKIAVGSVRDGDLENVGRPNALKESKKVYFDENKMEEGMMGFNREHYRDFLYRTWNGVLGANDWNTQTARQLWTELRAKNLDEIHMEAIRQAQMCDEKSKKILENLQKPFGI